MRQPFLSLNVQLHCLRAMDSQALMKWQYVAIVSSFTSSEALKLTFNGSVVPALRGESVPWEAVCLKLISSCIGLFQGARTKKSQEFVIKALLRLVTLWFRFGESQAVLGEVENQLNITDVEPWLSAIPQLIARLGTPQKDLQHTLIKLLKSISSHYPHAVIWPLLTATQTRKVEHQEAARVIMDYICSMSDGTRLADQAELVGRELIRTSTSWLEK